MALKYLLDTNICIYIAKKHPASVLRHFKKLSVGEIGMSIITHGELMYGAYKSQQVKNNLHTINEIATLIPTLCFPATIAAHYGEIRSKLEKKGKIIGNNDLWIAAHALAEDLVLVTNKTKEFSRINTLKIENWVQS